jgi:hypothetical protein
MVTSNFILSASLPFSRNMKRTFTILTVFLLIGCVGSTDKKKEEAKNDNSKFLEVYEEPMHKLVFEKDELKILDVQINPRDTTQFHLHRHPLFFVSLGWQKGADQSPNSNWIVSDAEAWPNGGTASDTSYITKPLVHRVTNIGSKVSRLIGILNLGKGLTSSLDSSEYETSNRWFRSKKIELKPNDTLIFRKLEFPTIAVFYLNDKVKVMKDNRVDVLNKNWCLVEDNSKLINSGDSKIEFIQIEVLNNNTNW